MDCLYEITKKFSAFMLTHYHCWIYENHKIESNRNDLWIDKKT